MKTEGSAEGRDATGPQSTQVGPIQRGLYFDMPIEL